MKTTIRPMVLCNLKEQQSYSICCVFFKFFLACFIFASAAHTFISSEIPNERAPMKSFRDVRSQSQTSTDKRLSLSLGSNLLKKVIKLFVIGRKTGPGQCHNCRLCVFLLYISSTNYSWLRIWLVEIKKTQTKT